jgi:outer membrane protein assembly factor BamB
VSLVAQQWPQWRGPRRDGVVTGVAPRATWPPRITRKWTVPIGIGYASPVIDGDRVFTLTREGDNEVVRALALSTGRQVWRSERRAPYQVNPAASAHGKGPKSTPALHGGRVFVLGIDGTLSAHDARTGGLAWRRTFSDRFPATAPLYGAAMSPAVVDGLLVAHVGGHDRGEILAIDTASGSDKWRWAGDGPGYASPIVAEIGGVRQIVTQTQKYLLGLEASSGAQLWREPFNVIYDQNIVTPVAWRDLLIFSGYQKGTFALRPRRQAQAWALEHAWNSPDVSMYMSSPVLLGDRLYGLAHRNRGQVFCMDPATGKVIWTGPGRQGDNAAILAANDVVFVLTTGGELLVVRATDRGFEVLSTYAVASSPTWAHPIVLSSGVLVKDEQTLAFWSW